MSKIRVGGLEVPMGSSIEVEVEADPVGITLPPININGTGGPVHVYRSELHYMGTVKFHMFGSKERTSTVKITCPHCGGAGVTSSGLPQTPPDTCSVCHGVKYLEGEPYSG